jgi:hypothetical protein
MKGQAGRWRQADMKSTGWHKDRKTDRSDRQTVKRHVDSCYNAGQAEKPLKVVTNEKGEAVGEVVTIIC